MNEAYRDYHIELWPSERHHPLVCICDAVEDQYHYFSKPSSSYPTFVIASLGCSIYVRTQLLFRLHKHIRIFTLTLTLLESNAGAWITLFQYIPSNTHSSNPVSHCVGTLDLRGPCCSNGRSMLVTHSSREYRKRWVRSTPTVWLYGIGDIGDNSVSHMCNTHMAPRLESTYAETQNKWAWSRVRGERGSKRGAIRCLGDVCGGHLGEEMVLFWGWVKLSIVARNNEKCGQRQPISQHI